MPKIPKSAEFDPVIIAEDALKSNFDPSVWTSLDDSDLPWARNWFEWLTGREFMDIVPYPAQVKIGTLFFEEYCPYCSDVDYLHNLFDQPLDEIREKVTFLEGGVCPKCGVTKTQIINDGLFHFHNELDICAGQRSGKTAITSMIAGYVLHKYLHLSDPSRYFGLLRSQTLHMTFVALTFKQATETIWQEFRDLVLTSPWMKTYFAWAKEKEKEIGETLVKNNQTFLWFGHKRLIVYPSSSNKKTLRGRTRFFTAIDELGWFDVNAEDRVYQDAQGTHTSLVNSLQTVRSASEKLVREGTLPEVLTGYDVNISSPSHVNDMIMRLVKMAKNKDRALSFHFATWEMNPNITQESILSSLEEDMDFERDFAAIPPMASDPWFPDWEMLETLSRDEDQSSFIKYSIEEDDIGRIYAELKHLKRDKLVPRVIGVDTGYSNNSFAIGIYSFNPEKGKIIVDGVIEVKPYDRKVVSFPKMFEVLIQLVQNLQVIFILFDRWNSIEYVQRLEDMKVRVRQISLKYRDFLPIRTLVRDTSFPKPELSLSDYKTGTLLLEEAIKDRPVFHLLLQILTVRDLGTKIVKPLGDSDDLFRTYALTLHWYQQDEFKRVLEQYSHFSSVGDKGPRRGMSEKSYLVTRLHSKGKSVPSLPGQGRGNGVFVKTRKGNRRVY